MRTGNIELMLSAQIKNFRPEVLAADPAVGDLVAAQTARMWYNSTDAKYKYFDGTAIKELGGGGSVEGAILADGTVPMTCCCLVQTSLHLVITRLFLRNTLKPLLLPSRTS